MHHVQIAQRAFNTPLMLDPAKALAFLSGLGPRIRLPPPCPPARLCSAPILSFAISVMEPNPLP